LYILNF